MESENCEEDDYEGKTEQSVREAHPSSYLLKIDSFSFLAEMLEKFQSESYESQIFEASGFKLKLHLYPNGDKEKQRGRFSMYLTIENTNSMPPGWEIHAELKFFVLDQIRDEYLVLQDAVKRLRRFHEARKEWGLARILSRDDFEDVAKGYLFQDKCVFGVEIFVCNYSGKGECVAKPAKLKGNSTYTWKVTDYSALANGLCSSPIFTLGDFKWKIDIYPRGQNSEEGKSLSAFLYFDGASTSSKVYAEFKLSIMDQKHSKHQVRQADYMFSPDTDWGWRTFMSLNDVQDPLKGFLVNDTF